ncbi:CoA-binding protein [Methylopila musalis]|uniref:CoA-binding protein n=1 Tax=Methylopila musalis TaxID=1134781 RepID=A0ABW3Z452_9HYPH
MTKDAPDDLIRRVLTEARTIAVVGASPNPARPSFYVARFLAERGYDVIPINPGQAGGEIDGRTVYARLADVPRPIDLVDVFRASEHLASVVDEVLALDPRPRALWTQLDVRDDAATARAEAAGLDVVVDRCPKMQIPRLRIPPRG